MGVNHSTKGTETVNAINNLALITGHIGRSGASPFSITGQCNAMGTRESRLHLVHCPGYRKFESAGDREELAALWNIDVARIPTRRGLAYPDIIEAAARAARSARSGSSPPIRSCRSRTTASSSRRSRRSTSSSSRTAFIRRRPPNSRTSCCPPPSGARRKAPTPTPSAASARSTRAVAPPGEARSDFDIFLGLAEELGVRDELFPGWSRPEDAFNEWRRVSAGRLCDYSGMSYDGDRANTAASSGRFPTARPIRRR